MNFYESNKRLLLNSYLIVIFAKINIISKNMSFNKKEVVIILIIEISPETVPIIKIFQYPNVTYKPKTQLMYIVKATDISEMYILCFCDTNHKLTENFKNIFLSHKINDNYIFAELKVLICPSMPGKILIINSQINEKQINKELISKLNKNTRNLHFELLN
jgi:hypothetical protein